MQILGYYARERDTRGRPTENQDHGRTESTDIRGNGKLSGDWMVIEMAAVHETGPAE
jgi:hypothetical protein